MIHRRFSLLSIVLVAGMAMAVVAYALEPTDAGINTPLMGNDEIYSEIVIDQIRDIDKEALVLMDSDRDGGVSLAEFTQTGGEDIVFEIIDTNKDNMLTFKDLSAFAASEETREQLMVSVIHCCWVYIGGKWTLLCW